MVLIYVNVSVIGFEIYLKFISALTTYSKAQ